MLPNTAQKHKTKINLLYATWAPKYKIFQLSIQYLLPFNGRLGGLHRSLVEWSLAVSPFHANKHNSRSSIPLFSLTSLLINRRSCIINH